MIKLINISVMKDVPKRKITLPKVEGDLIKISRLYFYWQHYTDDVQSFEYIGRRFYITAIADNDLKPEYVIHANAFDHTDQIIALFNADELIENNKSGDF